MTLSPHPTRFQKHSKKTITLLILILILPIDLAITGVYHYFKYGTIHKYAERRALRAQSDIFHHTLKPNTRSDNERWGHIRHTLITNSLGFKDKTIRTVPLTSNQYRILFIGDSFTEGVGYGYEDTFVGLVDQQLAEQGIEILNAAVGSYSPAIYYKKTEYLLEHLGLTFNHLMVFLDISDIEDEAKGYEMRDGRVVGIGQTETEIVDFFYEYTTIPRNILNQWFKLQQRFIKDHESLRSNEDKRYGMNRYRSLWTVSDAAFNDYGESGLTTANRHMDLLKELITRHKISMTLAVYPWPDQIINKDLNSIQVRHWKEWAEAHTVPFINLFPDFIQEGQEPKHTIGTYFIEGDSHWNAKGHQLIATRVLQELRQLSPPHLPVSSP